MEGHRKSRVRSCRIAELPIQTAEAARDITELNEAQEKLRESEERFRAIFDGATDGILVADVETKRFLIGNKTMCWMLGYSQEEITRLGVMDIHPAERVAFEMEQFESLTAGRIPHVADAPVKRKDGSVFHASISPALIALRGKRYLVGFFRDMTERKRDEEALRESEEKYRTLAESSLTGIFIRQDGRYVFVNDRFAEIHGYTAKELIGKEYAALVSPDDRGTVEQMTSQRLVGKIVPQRYEMRRLKNDGTMFWCEMMVARIEYMGKPAIMGNVIDVTERRKIEQDLRDANVRLSDTLTELKETQQQIILSERMSALGQMASGIMHDFNNALMPILGFSDLLLSNPAILDRREEAMSMLSDIHTAAKDAAQAVKRLRDFYRPPTDTEHVSVNLNRVIETAVTFTQPKWKEEMHAKGLTIEVRKDLHDIPLIKGNESQLREALTNLIFNSVDAMPDGGTITIHSRLVDALIHVEVSDTGEGMTEEVRRRCFDLFFSTKGIEGTGIGLTVTQGIIRQHGGTIEAESEPGKGTTVTIRLPQELHLEERKSGTLAAEFSRQLRVLVIDDDAWSCDLARRFLTAGKHTVEMAKSGKDGLEKFKEGTFDLVITDRAMADMSGDQVAKAIKTISQETPVILLTGFGDLMKDMGDHPPCVDMIVSKPITQRDLVHAIATVMTEKAPKT